MRSDFTWSSLTISKLRLPECQPNRRFFFFFKFFLKIKFGGFLLFCKKGFEKWTFFTNSIFFSEGRTICPQDDFFNQGKEKRKKKIHRHNCLQNKKSLPQLPTRRVLKIFFYFAILNIAKFDQIWCLDYCHLSKITKLNPKKKRKKKSRLKIVAFY